MTKDQWLSVRKQIPDGAREPWTVMLWVVDLLLVVVAWNLWLADSTALQLLGLALAGLATVQLYLIMHEATHGAASANRRFNDFIGHCNGWLIALPFLVRRRFHMAHHTWTAHPLNDPENRGMIERFSVMTKKQERTLEFVWKHWIPMIAANHFLLNWRAPFIAKAKGDSSPRILKEIRFARLYLAGYLAAAVLAWSLGHLLDLVLFYLITWVFLFFMVELLNLPHHAEAPLLARDADRLQFWEQDGVSHDCKSLPLWSRFVILNFNLHIVHHAFPSVPWYRLAKVQKLLGEHELGHAPSQTHEWEFAVKNRRRPLLQLMGHFFDQRG
ncbi:fatty acid desaturase family protein [Pseudomonas sp. CCOS 191]|uniref:fatty acid desaturase family protein n=1 Tax=Pseudomonas sp. CCOS 191 TaxID=1649877 RepID=UPI0006245EE3|nr:fatty acid desaturase [Pseudomonas sp. CCOS 191]CRI57174.1 fatty acid desaturase [Pseudomonas sp. CCOS 191]